MLVLPAILAGTATAQTTASGETEIGKMIRMYKGEEVINLNLQQAELIRISQSADVMVVGDPAIADVTLVSDTMLLMTPKSVGSTNVFVLDTEGKIILESKMVVQEEGLKRIKARRGGSSTTYLCRDSEGCVEIESDDTAVDD